MSTVTLAKTAAPNVRSFYTRVSALGFGLIALTGLVVLIYGLARGDLANSAPFALVFIGVGLLVAGVVWRWGRWTLIVAGLLSLALLGLVGPMSLFILGHPESASDFIPILLAMAGALLGLAGSIVTIVQWRRKTGRASGTRTERRVLGTVLGAITLAILLSLVLTLTGRTAVAAELKAGALGMQLKGFSYSPETLQVKAGETVRMVVKNNDPTLHTFTLPEVGVDVSVPPGSEKIIEFQAPAAGSYQWYCIPHSGPSGSTRQGMVGTLQVP